MTHKLKVNGKVYEVDAARDTPLLWILRDHLGLTGTKYGCGIGECGACTVHLEGAAVRSCLVAVSDAAGSAITTIEGLSADSNHPLQQAWVEMDVPQCGYCQSGMLMAAASLLKEKPHATDKDIDLALTNICRCGTYPRVRSALHKVIAESGRGKTTRLP